MSLMVCSKGCSGSDGRVPVGRVRPPCPVPRPRAPSGGSGVSGIVMWSMKGLPLVRPHCRHAAWLEMLCVSQCQHLQRCSIGGKTVGGPSKLVSMRCSGVCDGCRVGSVSWPSMVGLGVRVSCSAMRRRMTGWSSIAGRSGGGSEGVSDSGSVLLCGSGSGSGRLQRWLVRPLGGECPCWVWLLSGRPVMGVLVSMLGLPWKECMWGRLAVVRPALQGRRSDRS